MIQRIWLSGNQELAASLVDNEKSDLKLAKNDSYTRATRRYSRLYLIITGLNLSG